MYPTEQIVTFSVSADTWLPTIDHQAPCILAYSFFQQVDSAIKSSPPPDRYVESQASPAVDPNEAALAWITANWETLVDQYPNCWIVVGNGGVVASSRTLEDLQRQIAHLAIERPFITKVGESRTIVWKTAYAHS